MEIKTKVTKIADSFQRTDKYGLSVEHLIADSPEKTFLVTKVGNRFNVSVAVIKDTVPAEEPEKKGIEDGTETREPVGRVQERKRTDSSKRSSRRKRH